MISRSSLKKAAITSTVVFGICACEAAFRIADAQALASYDQSADHILPTEQTDETLDTTQEALSTAIRLLLP